MTQGKAADRPRRGTASERIMVAATDLLVQDRGQLELDRLAEAANCTTGAIYHNFGSKAGVLAAVTGRYNEKLNTLVAPSIVPEQRADWLDELRGAVERTIAFMWRDPLTPVIVAETIKDASAAAEAERWLRVHVATLSAHLAEAQAKGHLGPLRDVEIAAAGLAGGMRQILRVFMTRPATDLAVVYRETWAFTACCLFSP